MFQNARVDLFGIKEESSVIGHKTRTLQLAPSNWETDRASVIYILPLNKFVVFLWPLRYYYYIIDMLQG